MNAQPVIAVLIPAAGASSRMATGVSKILAPLAGEPVIRHTVRIFQRLGCVSRIHVICRPQERAALQACFADASAWSKLGPFIDGGRERCDSVFRGLAALAGHPPDIVLVHDGARPFCSTALVERLLAALKGTPAAIPVVPIPDTVRRRAGGLSEVIDRSTLMRTQTPQGFAWPTLHAAYQAGMAAGGTYTDDAQFVEATGQRVATVPGEARNIKITLAQDLAIGAWLLQHPDWGVVGSA